MKNRASSHILALVLIFGFQVAGPNEVRRARERLRAAGVTETEWQEDGNFVRVQVADPDGYRVELFAF